MADHSPTYGPNPSFPPSTPNASSASSPRYPENKVRN